MRTAPSPALTLTGTRPQIQSANLEKGAVGPNPVIVGLIWERAIAWKLEQTQKAECETQTVKQVHEEMVKA